MKQNLDKESIDGLVSYRIQRSKETLSEAKLMVDGGYLNGAINRLYYACYYMVSALLLKNEIYAQTHSGVKQMLGLHFIITGKLSPKESSVFATLFEKRHSSDYDDFAYYDQEMVDKLYPKTVEFIETIERLINS
jgi:uncharacterized protein (UPF0332 family)